ncbi:MAG: CehA/McbA family metallohydrolase [Caldilineaceae bacterium]|nr:CehA/McbA family metallohydrolase [Caldilineaceae bacterium]
MQPVSPHFTPIDLADVYNWDRESLPSPATTPGGHGLLRGSQSFSGIPFELAQESAQENVIWLDASEVALPLHNNHATWLIFLHAAEDRPTNYLDDFADSDVDGNELGEHVADYTLEYADGTRHETPILRRFAIQQSRIGWGASPFLAMPALSPQVFATVTEDAALGKIARSYGRGETRVHSGRERTAEKLWLYALPNPHPDKPLRRLLLTPVKERAVIYAISATQLAEHPLRPGLRHKVRVTLPDGVQLNALGECDELSIDLGTVISARAVLEYDHSAWLGGETVDVQPTRSEREIVVEYSAHPAARLYIGAETVYDLAALPGKAAAGIVEVPPAYRPVNLRVVEKGSTRQVAVRIHLHGAHGEYLPPRGRHRKVNPYWFEDNYGEFVNGRNQYSYIDGHCEVDLPLGEVYVEITKGYECAPIRTKVVVGPETSELTFELERVLGWREKGWVTADTHVHFLSPTTALLEGQAEDVHVVNLLASQWGEMYSNVSDFDGRTTLGAKEFGGDGEFLVRVGTENRMQVLGHISLLGYSGQMIHPLCTGGPSESALGDAQEVVMAEWAQRCIEQGGLVVMPHAPNPQLERAADIVLGLVNAIELMTFNPHDAQLNPYGIADWYRYLNLGYQVPLVGGSDKMAAASLLGGVRTYAHLGGREFSYENWMAAVRTGNTFATVGPLAELLVEGVPPGGQVRLPASGGSIDISWRVESTRVPIELVETVIDGHALDTWHANGEMAAEGSISLSVTKSCWVALRVRGSYRGTAGDIAAHTSAVQVLVGDQPLFNETDADAVLSQIEGSIAYLDVLAPRPADASRLRQMRATLEGAHNRLHQRMHQHGVYHKHTPLHKHRE